MKLWGGGGEEEGESDGGGGLWQGMGVEGGAYGSIPGRKAV